MRHLVTAAILGLVFAFATTAIAEPLTTAPVAKKKKKCFKKKHGKRVRVKCKKPKKPATQTPVNPAPTTPTAPATTPDTTGQAAIDQMTNELKGGRWRYFTSGSDSSTVYVLNLCADGTFLRTGESVGVQVYRYGTWKVTEASILGDGTGGGARVVGTTTQSDPPGAEDLVADLAVRSSDSQWYWNDNAAQYFAGAAQCS